MMEERVYIHQVLSPLLLKSLKLLLTCEDDGSCAPTFIYFGFCLILLFFPRMRSLAVFILIIVTFYARERERGNLEVIKLASRTDLHHLGIFL